MNINCLRFLVTIWVVLFIISPLYPSPGEKPGAYLGELTWPEARARIKQAPLVILPFGAGAKEHGPHLPMNADFKVMDIMTANWIRILKGFAKTPLIIEK